MPYLPDGSWIDDEQYAEMIARTGGTGIPTSGTVLGTNYNFMPTTSGGGALNLGWDQTPGFGAAINFDPSAGIENAFISDYDVSGQGMANIGTGLSDSRLGLTAGLQGTGLNRPNAYMDATISDVVPGLTVGAGTDTTPFASYFGDESSKIPGLGITKTSGGPTDVSYATEVVPGVDFNIGTAGGGNVGVKASGTWDDIGKTFRQLFSPISKAGAVTEDTSQGYMGPGGLSFPSLEAASQAGAVQSKYGAGGYSGDPIAPVVADIGDVQPGVRDYGMAGGGVGPTMGGHPGIGPGGGYDLAGMAAVDDEFAGEDDNIPGISLPSLADAQLSGAFGSGWGDAAHHAELAFGLPGVHPEIDYTSTLTGMAPQPLRDVYAELHDPTGPVTSAISNVLGEFSEINSLPNRVQSFLGGFGTGANLEDFIDLDDPVGGTDYAWGQAYQDAVNNELFQDLRDTGVITEENAFDVMAHPNIVTNTGLQTPNIPSGLTWDEIGSIVSSGAGTPAAPVPTGPPPARSIATARTSPAPVAAPAKPAGPSAADIQRDKQAAIDERNAAKARQDAINAQMAQEAAARQRQQQQAVAAEQARQAQAAQAAQAAQEATRRSLEKQMQNWQGRDRQDESAMAQIQAALDHIADLQGTGVTSGSTGDRSGEVRDAMRSVGYGGPEWT